MHHETLDAFARTSRFGTYDPRVKLVSAILAIVVLSVISEPKSLAAMLGLSLALLAISRIPVRHLLRHYLLTLPFIGGASLALVFSSGQMLGLLLFVRSSAVVAAFLIAAVATAATPTWNAIVSPAGSIRIEREGREIASLIPGLYEATWRSASLNEGKPGREVTAGVHRGTIRAPGGTIVNVQLHLSSENDQAQLEYRLTPQATLRLNSLHVGLRLLAVNFS